MTTRFYVCAKIFDFSMHLKSPFKFYRDQNDTQCENFCIKVSFNGKARG